MAKKKRINTKKPESPNILDKLVEQSFTQILSFIFTTALIGSCGYLLLQFSGELNSLDRELLEYDVKVNQLNSFNEMLDVVSTGWLADETENSRFSEIVKDITDDVLAENLDPAFVSESLDWLSSSLLRISKEQGQVKGYQVFSEVKQILQNNFVAQYGYWINYIKETDSIIRHWDKDSPAERDKKLESLQYQLLDSLTNLSETQINLAQLREQNELDKKLVEQDTNELLTKSNILWIKFSLASTGIIVGLATFFYLGKSAVKKYGFTVK